MFGIPVVFGIEIHWLTSTSCLFPVARPFYGVGWQSVVACGYDDSKKCLLVRNSWGTNWGKKGYGWLPYEYVIRNHAADFWIMFKDEWIGPMAEQEVST
jgi:C1A family cysteine protease